MESLGAVVLSLTLWVSSVTGWTPIQPPEIRQMPVTEAYTAGNVPLRGYYNPLEKVIYVREIENQVITLEDKAVLAHELVHTYQGKQSRLSTTTFKTAKDCEEYHAVEMEAYDIEDMFRKQNGLKVSNRFTQEMAKASCLVQVGYIVFPWYVDPSISEEVTDAFTRLR